MDNDTYKNMANEKIASFDHTYSSDHIRMLKILLHYIPAEYKKNLAIYIKYLELQHAFNDKQDISSDHTNHAAEIDSSSQESFGFTSLIRELMPFCNAKEKQQFHNLENMLSNFEQIKNMMEMMEMMKDMKDMFGGEEGNINPEMLAGMMGMDGFDFSQFPPFS